jgi:hypothetical protein
MKSRFRIASVVVVSVLLATVLASCGGSAGSKTGGGGLSGAVDACQLITQADAEAVLGGTVRAPEHPVEGEGAAVVTSCKYIVAAEPSMNNVALIVRKLDTVEAARQDFEQSKKDTVSRLNTTPEEVAGLGDSSYWIGGAYNCGF